MLDNRKTYCFNRITIFLKAVIDKKLNAFALLFLSLKLIVVLGSCHSYTISDNATHSTSEILVENGKNIYQQSCKSCHALFKDCTTFGNSWVFEDTTYFDSFVNNQIALIEAKDPYALDLQLNWGNSSFRHQFGLRPKDIKALMLYINETNASN